MIEKKHKRGVAEISRVDSMRKYLAAILAVFVLFSSAQADLGASFSTGRAITDQMEQKYGIRILIGNECLGIYSMSYDFTSAEVGGSPFQTFFVHEDTEKALLTMDQEFSLYPAQFFSSLKENCVFFLSDISTVKTDRSPPPDSRIMTGSTTIFFDTFQLVPMAIHHELWHAIEARAGSERFIDWESLTTQGLSTITPVLIRNTSIGNIP